MQKGIEDAFEGTEREFSRVALQTSDMTDPMVVQGKIHPCNPFTQIERHPFGGGGSSLGSSHSCLILGSRGGAGRDIHCDLRGFNPESSL